MKKNFEIKKGATFEYIVQWLNCDDTHKDLAGYSARMQIRDKENKNIILELTELNGGIAIDILTSSITLKITAEITASVATSIIAGVYDLEAYVHQPSSEQSVTRLLEGKITFTNEVTR